MSNSVKHCVGQGIKFFYGLTCNWLNGKLDIVVPSPIILIVYEKKSPGPNFFNTILQSHTAESEVSICNLNSPTTYFPDVLLSSRVPKSLPITLTTAICTKRQQIPLNHRTRINMAKQPWDQTNVSPKFSSQFDVDRNLLEFERCVIRQESVQYSETSSDIFQSDTNVKSRSQNSLISENMGNRMDDYNDRIRKQNTHQQHQKVEGGYNNNMDGRVPQTSANPSLFQETRPPAPQVPFLDHRNQNNLEVNFSDVFDTSYNAVKERDHCQLQHRQDKVSSKVDHNTYVINRASILDSEFDVPSDVRLEVPKNTAPLGDEGVTADGEKVHESVADIQLGDKSKLTMASEDNNVLHSPASRHLISQFEKFLVKELIIKRSPTAAMKLKQSKGLTSQEERTVNAQIFEKRQSAGDQKQFSSTSVHSIGGKQLKGDSSNTVTISQVSISSKFPADRNASNGNDDGSEPDKSSEEPAKIPNGDGTANVTTRAENSVTNAESHFKKEHKNSHVSIKEQESSNDSVVSKQETTEKPITLKIVPETIVTESLLTVKKYQVEEDISPSMNPAESVKKDEDLKRSDRPRLVSSGKVPCRYAFSGCKEMLERGSMHEQDHQHNCKYRPLNCLLSPACKESLSYHNYIPHLMQHFLVPTYSTEVITPVILTPEDFKRNQTWTPKWFSAHKQHFFAMLSRKDDGLWTSWVWMLGTPEEADNYAVRITLFKGLKEVSQVSPVHSIRTKLEDIEEQRTCLFLNDQRISELTQIGTNLLADFSLKAQLISNAKQLNNTTRELRAMSRSKAKPMPSEKLYGITVHAEESDEET